MKKIRLCWFLSDLKEKSDDVYLEGPFQDGGRLEHNKHHDPRVLPLAQLVQDAEEVGAGEHVPPAAGDNALIDDTTAVPTYAPSRTDSAAPWTGITAPKTPSTSLQGFCRHLWWVANDTRREVQQRYSAMCM